MSNTIALDNEYIMHTYGRYPLVVKSAKSATVTDEDGKQYIDFSSGIGTLSLGSCNEGWMNAVKEQLSSFSHISNYYYSPVTSLLAKDICDASGMKNVFFGNSGAEANEGAIKIARKYSFDKYGKDRNVIVTFNSSFHGRTVTTLAATAQDVFHNFFFPFTEGFKYSPLNDKSALESALTEDVCAVMVEPIQGEGGVNVMTDEFADFLHQLCAQKDILIIFDEVQSGIARTGKMFAHQYFNFLPDIMTLAKGLGGGLPIGAVVCGEKCAEVLGKGQHGTTFGGNPVCCAGAHYVMNTVNNPEFLNSVIEKGNYIKERIKNECKEHVICVRGKGLMIGIQTELDIKVMSKKALEAGLLILTAGSDVLRLLPPLNIKRAELEKGTDILIDLINKGEKT